MNDTRNKKDKNQHIQVFVRVRPINSAERASKSPVVVDVQSNKEIVVRERPQDKLTKKFTFDRVFGPSSKQIDVYQAVVNPLLEEVLAGYNCTVFAYGQTGTGKTFTMEGSCNDPAVHWQADTPAGIIPRALSHLFDELRILGGQEYTVRVSFLELYNEELFDLLSPNDDASKIRIYEDASRKGAIIIHGLEEVTVHNKNEVYKILEKGSEKRQTAATLMNAQSSRSHTVFSITVHIKENTVEGEELLKTGKLNLVDLAGSENVGRSGAVDRRAREAGNINQSLLTLGRVITALVERAPHIPYRESKLTRLLQESLGGRTKTSIIATISPACINIEESLSTLDYAHRAKNITNRPEINQKLSKKALLKEYTEEIERLRRDLLATRERNGVYLAQENYNEMQNLIEIQTKEIEEKINHIKALEETMTNKEKLFNDLKLEFESTSNALCMTQEKLECTKNVLKTTKTKLNETTYDRDLQKHLVEKHKTTEMNLTNQAQTLKSVSDIATSDVHKLHEKISRKKKVEDENETVSQRFQQDMSNCFHHIDETLEVRTRELVDFYSSLENQMKIIRDHQSKQIDAAIDHISKDLVSQEETNSGKLIEAIDHFHNEYNSWVRARMEESSNMNQEERRALENILDQVSLKHRQFFESNMKISENLKLLCNDTSSKLISLTDSAKKFFNDFCNSLLVDRNTLTQQMENIKKSVETVVENHSQNMEDDESISQLFTDFRKQLDEMQKKYDGYRANKKERDSIMSTELSGVRTMSNKITEETSSNYSKNVRQEKIIEEFLEEHVTVIKKNVSSTLEQNWKRAYDANVDSDNTFRGLETDLNARKSALRSFNNNFQASATKLQPAAEKRKEGIHAIVQDLHKIVTEASTTHTQMAEDQRSHMQDSCSGVNEKLEHLSTESLSHKKDLTTQLQSMHVKVERFIGEELQRDKPTGDTPVRRDFVYPRNLVATSPYERIIQKFRETRRDVELSDDEADNTMTEILSPNLNDKDCNSLSTPIRSKNNNVKSSTPYSESKSRLPVIHSNYSLIKSASTSDLPLTTKPQLDSTALSESEILKEQDNKENGQDFVKPEKSRIKLSSKTRNSKKILSSHNNS